MFFKSYVEDYLFDLSNILRKINITLLTPIYLMKKLFVFLLLTLIFGCLVNGQTTVADALSVNFINPKTSQAAWPINGTTIGPGATESFGLADYDGNSTSTSYQQVHGII